MLAGFFNCFKIPELREKIYYTLAVLFVVRIGSSLPLPGLDPAPLQNFYLDQTSSGKGSFLGLYNLFTGGALLNGAVCALGIMPYISASIIMQLMGAFMPSIARLNQEGDSGRQKVSQYVRYLTIVICLIQGFLLIRALSSNPGMLFGGNFDTNVYGSIVIANRFIFLSSSILFLTTGTLLLVWLGDQISNKGIGNGISLIIAVGIVSDLPKAIYSAVSLFSAPAGVEARLSGAKGLLMLFVLFLVIAGIICVTQAVRKIPVHYAQRVVGKQVYGGQNSFLPFKVNYSGVMPVIFGSAILMFPMQIFSQIGGATGIRFFVDAARTLERGSWIYYTLFSLLILVFSYFWVSIMFKPKNVADDLKKSGGYIPGIRPGVHTAQFLDFVMTRLTLAGATFLTIIAVFPDLLFFTYNIPYQISMFFGGTGMLITVGVILDTMKQIETILIQKNYDGFDKKGVFSKKVDRIGIESILSTSYESRSMLKIWLPLVILFVVGLVSSIWV